MFFVLKLLFLIFLYLCSMEKERNLEEVLADIFNQKPLPNRLKTPKSQWLKGKLGLTGAARIIAEYSDYEVVTICRIKRL